MRWITLFVLSAIFPVPGSTPSWAQAQVQAETPEAILEKKLKAIVIPEAKFGQVPFEFAIEFLEIRSRELDRSTADPRGKGINLVVRESDGEMELVTMDFANIPLAEALEKVAKGSGREVRIEHSAVVLAPPVPGKGKGKTKVKEPENEVPASAAVRAKLKAIRIPAIEFDGTPLSDAITLLQTRSVQLDPEKKGITFEIAKLPEKKPNEFQLPGGPGFRLKLSNVSLEDTLYHVCGQTGMRYELQPGKVILSPEK